MEINDFYILSHMFIDRFFFFHSESYADETTKFCCLIC